MEDGDLGIVMSVIFVVGYEWKVLNGLLEPLRGMDQNTIVGVAGRK